jgi:tetratricopeptide (TPR) repeat protein
VVQLLAETGVIGVAAAAVLIVGITLAVRRQWRQQPRAIWAITVFAVACVGTNPTAFVFLTVPIIVWTAFLVPAENARGSKPRKLGVMQVAAVVVTAAVGVSAVASLAYEASRGSVQRQQLEAAETYATVATFLDPALPIYWRALAEIEMARGATNAAIQHYKRAVAASPKDSAGHRALALAYVENDLLAEATQAADKALELRPQSYRNWLTAAAVADAAGDEPKSVAALARALEIAPELAISFWSDANHDTQHLTSAIELAGSPDHLHDQPMTLNHAFLAVLAGHSAGSTTDSVVGPTPLTTRAVVALSNCAIEEAVLFLAEGRRSEGEFTHYWVVSAVVQQLSPDSGLPRRREALLYLRLEGPVPTHTSLSENGSEDAWQYRRLPMTVGTDTFWVPSVLYGRQLLLTEDLRSLPAFSEWRRACHS